MSVLAYSSRLKASTVQASPRTSSGLAQTRAQGRNVTLSREPGGTLLAEKLRELVLNDPMDALTEAC